MESWLWVRVMRRGQLRSNQRLSSSMMLCGLLSRKTFSTRSSWLQRKKGLVILQSCWEQMDFLLWANFKSQEMLQRGNHSQSPDCKHYTGVDVPFSKKAAEQGQSVKSLLIGKTAPDCQQFFILWHRSAATCSVAHTSSAHVTSGEIQRSLIDR